MGEPSTYCPLSLIKQTERTSAEAQHGYIPGHLLAESPETAGKSALIRIWSRRHIEESLLIPAVAEPLIVWVLSGAAALEERELQGSWRRHTLLTGSFCLTNTPAPYELRWQTIGTDPFHVMHLHLALPVFNDAAREVLQQTDVEVPLQTIFGGTDHVLSLLLKQMHLEVISKNVASPLFINGVAQSLAVHLVRTYHDKTATPVARQGVLPTSRLRRVIDLMEGRLGEDFKLEPLAHEAGMSAFHFSRLFKRTTGFAPSQFFIRLRMAEARRLLRETDKRIIDVGLEVGYSSPSRFSHVFQRQVGISPNAYRGS